MKHEILIYNKTLKRIPEKFIKTVIIKTLDFLRIKQPVAMAVLVIGKEEIKMLNKIWRKKNEAPDELSFGLNSRKNKKFANEDNGVLELGEIIVNIEKISDKNYLSKILAHGLLHLLGHNHSRIEILEKQIHKNS